MATSQIIGVTGSTGKTTVKFILGNVLKIFGKTYFSQDPLIITMEYH